MVTIEDYLKSFPEFTYTTEKAKPKFIFIIKDKKNYNVRRAMNRMYGRISERLYNRN
jgi:hypothetical protein